MLSKCGSCFTRIFQIFDVTSGMLSDSSFLQCAIQLEIQRKGRLFVYFANILIILRTRIRAKFSRNRIPDSFSSFSLLCFFESFCQAGKCVSQ